MSGKRSSIWFRQLLTQRLDRKFIEKIHGEIGVLLVEGIRDDGYLDLMEFYVKPELVDEDIYNVSGRILYDIIEKHPFWDGNKRTGFTAATTVLAFANRTIKVPDEDVEAFCLDLASRFEQSEKGEIPPDEGPEIEGGCGVV